MAEASTLLVRIEEAAFKKARERAKGTPIGTKVAPFRGLYVLMRQSDGTIEKVQGLSRDEYNEILNLEMA